MEGNDVKTIMLVCTAGMSTSLLVNKIKNVVEKRGLDVKVLAVSQAELMEYQGDLDVLLLGPQVKYLLKKMKEMLEIKGTMVSIIDSIDYGTLNGEAVLDQALELLS